MNSTTQKPSSDMAIEKLFSRRPLDLFIRAGLITFLVV
jgi:hypothetical protein